MPNRSSSRDGGRPGDAVDGQAGVALELAERGRGQVAEDAVDPPGVEPERAQPLLQLGHVVAPQHRGAAVEEAVAEAPAGLDQGGPGLAAADAVDPQAPAVLEGLDRGPGALPEDARRGRSRRAAELGEAVLDVGDRLPLAPIAR